MSDLRLVPAALSLWCVAVVVTWSRSLALGLGFALCLAVALALWHKPQAIAVGAAAIAGALRTWHSVRAADRFDFSKPLRAEVSSMPHSTEHGWFFRAKVAGFPGELPVITTEAPKIQQFDLLILQGKASPSGGLGRTLYVAEDIHYLGAQGGLQHLSLVIKLRFQALVQQHSNGEAIGLLPAMILGDASLQDTEAKQRYAATGLAHLSAVSGGNVAMLTTAVLAIATLLGASRALALTAALLSLGAFVFIVGPEPSVLRAGVMGSLALVAMMAQTRAPPIHGLSIAILVLLLYEPSLATSFGMSLSSFATAGIIAAYPLIYRSIATPYWPDVLSRMVAVALAAELATLPLVVAMSQRVSLVAVPANVLVAPVVPIITVAGLCAVLLEPTVVGAVVIRAITPLANWIARVAYYGYSLPFARVNVQSDPLTLAWMVLAVAWILFALASRRPTVIILVSLSVGCVLMLLA
ncbi:ComEC/Rec2 family competence protein [Corynebacterium pseudopelargi]|uniref:ComEC family competence protein n=1 Tax=Corynebacterium pseudopelargi TaxID=2080757 RepID=A0A3G6ISX9_9CORY|nr:ComEC/Rec2 family competence protein [Corynebacterium pseudopelargi]AZA08752.1 ComEC family competence protein [Corynebacterium pseudopelargi]